MFLFLQFNFSSLLSRFIRKDVTVLGKFALNITNIPALKLDEKKENEKSKQDTQELKNFSECFFDSIKDLVPTVYIEISTTKLKITYKKKENQ